MKNEKFCFNKGVGLIAFIGIVLIGFVLASQTLTSTKTSTNSRASGKAKTVTACGYNQPCIYTPLSNNDPNLYRRNTIEQKVCVNNEIPTCTAEKSVNVKNNINFFLDASSSLFNAKYETLNKTTIFDEPSFFISSLISTGTVSGTKPYTI